MTRHRQCNNTAQKWSSWNWTGHQRPFPNQTDKCILFKIACNLRIYFTVKNRKWLGKNWNFWKRITDTLLNWIIHEFVHTTANRFSGGQAAAASATEKKMKHYFYQNVTSNNIFDVIACCQVIKMCIGDYSNDGRAFTNEHKSCVHKFNLNSTVCKIMVSDFHGLKNDIFLWCCRCRRCRRVAPFIP